MNFRTIQEVSLPSIQQVLEEKGAERTDHPRRLIAWRRILIGGVFPQAPFHAHEHLPPKTLAGQTPVTLDRSQNRGIGRFASIALDTTDAWNVNGVEELGRRNASKSALYENS
jgi:hypothetical protein